MNVVCPRSPPVIRFGSTLVLNDGTGRRFFAAGMVYSTPSMLSTFDEREFEAVVRASRAAGATTLRWNCFLKGIDLVFGSDGYVQTFRGDSLAAIKRGLDIAKQHGILVQVVFGSSSGSNSM